MLSQSGSRTTSNRVTLSAAATILSPWPCVRDRGVHLVPELGEVVPEHLREARGLCIVGRRVAPRSEEHTSELQSRLHLVCRLLLETEKLGGRMLDEPVSVYSFPAYLIAH